MERALIAYLRRVALALDRFFNALLDGPDDQTMSQTVGLAQLAGDWWGRPVALILEVINWERHHCIRSLYRDEDGRPIWPDRMPPGSPSTNPYPDARPA